MLMAGGRLPTGDVCAVKDEVLAGKDEVGTEETEALGDRPRLGLVATGGIGLEIEALLP